MNIGKKLSAFLDKQSPSISSRALTYNNREAELNVKFKNQLPSPVQVGLIVSTALAEMSEAGYNVFGSISTLVEGGVKMTIIVRAKRANANPNSKAPLLETTFDDESTVGNAFEKKEDSKTEDSPVVPEKPDLNTDKEDRVLSLTLAMEYGYLQCEKGNNLMQAMINFENTLKGKRKK